MQRPASGFLGLISRLGVLMVGTILLAAGIILIVTPEPAVVLVPLGLGVLATEFPGPGLCSARAVERASRRQPFFVGRGRPAGGTHRSSFVRFGLGASSAGCSGYKNSCTTYTFLTACRACVISLESGSCEPLR
jgi:hypothetical protein